MQRKTLLESFMTIYNSVVTIWHNYRKNISKENLTNDERLKIKYNTEANEVHTVNEISEIKSTLMDEIITKAEKYSMGDFPSLLFKRKEASKELVEEENDTELRNDYVK